MLLTETLVNIQSVTGAEAEISAFVRRRLPRALPKERGDAFGTLALLVWRGPSRAVGRCSCSWAPTRRCWRWRQRAHARREGDRPLSWRARRDAKVGDAVDAHARRETRARSGRAARGLDLRARLHDAEGRPGRVRLISAACCARCREPVIAARCPRILLEPTDLTSRWAATASANAGARARRVRACPARPGWARTPWARRGVARGESRLSRDARARAGHRVPRDAARWRRCAPGARARRARRDGRQSQPSFPPDAACEAVATSRARAPLEFGFDVVNSAHARATSTSIIRECGRSCAASGATVAGKQGWTDVAQFSLRASAFNFGQHRDVVPRPTMILSIRHRRAYERLASFLSDGGRCQSHRSPMTLHRC